MVVVVLVARESVDGVDLGCRVRPSTQVDRGEARLAVGASALTAETTTETAAKATTETAAKATTETSTETSVAGVGVTMGPLRCGRCRSRKHER